MMCINNNSTDAYFNLAAEEYLLNSFPKIFSCFGRMNRLL